MPIAIDIPESVLPLFRAAGWPNTEQEVPQVTPLHHPATAILREFHGLTVGKCVAGEECATGDIAFGNDIDYEQDNQILEWQKLLSTELVNIAEFCHAHGALFIDTSGACYGMSLVHDAFWFLGASFGTAAECILLGRKGQPMLRPSQTSITLFGERIEENHPSVHKYKIGK